MQGMRQETRLKQWKKIERKLCIKLRCVVNAKRCTRTNIFTFYERNEKKRMPSEERKMKSQTIKRKEIRYNSVVMEEQQKKVQRAHTHKSEAANETHNNQ